MWAFTQKLVLETRNQAHPAAKAGLGLVVAVVALGTGLLITLKVLAKFMGSVLKVANDGLYAGLQNAQIASREAKADGDWISQPLSHDLPDGLPSYCYTGNDPRWLDRYHEDDDTI